MTRKHFAEAVELHHPRPEIADQRFLEAGAESRHLGAARPTRTLGATLEAIASEKIRMLRLQVPKARNVDRIGAVAYFAAVLRPRQCRAGAPAHDVVHQIVAELSARVAQSRGEFARRRVEED